MKRFRRAAAAEAARATADRPPNVESAEPPRTPNGATEQPHERIPDAVERSAAEQAPAAEQAAAAGVAGAEEGGDGLGPASARDTVDIGEVVPEPVEPHAPAAQALHAVERDDAGNSSVEAAELAAAAIEAAELAEAAAAALEAAELDEAARAALEAADLRHAGDIAFAAAELRDAADIAFEAAELDDAADIAIEAAELAKAADIAIEAAELASAAGAALEAVELRDAGDSTREAPAPSFAADLTYEPPEPELLGTEAPGRPPPIGRVRTRWIAEDGAWETTQRGRQIVNDPRLYRGVAFNDEERRQLGLVGLLPPQVVSLHEQLVRAAGQYAAQPTNLAKNVYLALLQDRNEVLFYRLLSDHLPEMLPVIYTPTVGEAIQHYSQEYRRPRGVFLSVDHPDDIELSLLGTGLGPEDVDLIVATDGEAILGIGDWGVGGINISLGKLAVYTAAGGIDPGRAIAVMLDVGTNRQTLLEDPLYLGNRHPRVDDATYDAFIDTFVERAAELFPTALLHWEDLRARNARRILQRWRDSAFTFNDDMQGTGAVALSAVMSGLRRTNERISDQRVVIFGAGTAGIGIAEQLRLAMIADGLDPVEATARFWCIDQQGLLIRSLDPVTQDFQRPFARPDADVETWDRDEHGRIDLMEVIRHVEATILIGTSGQRAAFTENTIRTMALSCRNPIILPLSNPTELAEAEPGDIMQWTGGRALVATGSAFDPVTYAWSTHYIGQANNAFVFPGIGLGVTLVGATQVTDGMLLAAAEAISSQVDTSIDGAPLLPEVDSLHTTSVAVAAAVGRAAIAEGVAKWALPEPAEEAAEAAMWRPEYRPIRAV